MKVNFKSISILTAAMFTAAPAFSAPVTVDFEGTHNFGFIDGYYNGGTDDALNSGPNLGITFGDDFQPTANQPEFDPYFSNLPGPGTTAVSVLGGDALMSSNAGFTGQVTFKYSMIESSIINVFDGIDGTGNLLGSVTLAANANTCSAGLPYCVWELGTLNFSGVAHSIQFADAANVAYFDDITISQVPLPAAGWLLFSALGGLGTMVRRKRAAA